MMQWGVRQHHAELPVARGHGCGEEVLTRRGGLAGLRGPGLHDPGGPRGSSTMGAAELISRPSPPGLVHLTQGAPGTGPRSATITANGLSSRCLRACSSAGGPSRWPRPPPGGSRRDPLPRAPGRMASCGAPVPPAPADPVRWACRAGQRRVPSAARRASLGPQAGQHNRLGVEPAVRGVVILRCARGAHGEARHRGQRPVIGHVADDGEPVPQLVQLMKSGIVAETAGRPGRRASRSQSAQVVAVSGDQGAAPLRPLWPRVAGHDGETDRPSGVIGWALTRSTRASDGASCSSAARKSRMCSAGPSTSANTPSTSLPTQPARPSRGGQGVHERAELHPLDDTLDPDGGPLFFPGRWQPPAQCAAFPGGPPVGWRARRRPPPRRIGSGIQVPCAQAQAWRTRSADRSLMMSRRSASAASRLGQGGGQHHAAVHVVVVLPRFVGRLRHAGSSRRAAGSPQGRGT